MSDIPAAQWEHLEVCFFFFFGGMFHATLQGIPFKTEPLLPSVLISDPLTDLSCYLAFKLPGLLLR